MAIWAMDIVTVGVFFGMDVLDNCYARPPPPALIMMVLQRLEAEAMPLASCNKARVAYDAASW